MTRIFKCLDKSLKPSNNCARLYASGAQPKSNQDDDLFANVASAPPPSIDFKDWYLQMKDKLSSANGPFFLGNTRPFALNEVYSPKNPLSVAVKHDIYSTWKSDPQKWTPMQLSLKYCITVNRAKAIVKMAHHKESMCQNGWRINKTYVGQMEKILGSIAHIAKNQESLPNTDDLVQNLTPKLLQVPEGQTISFSEASKIIKRKPKTMPLKETLSLDVSHPYRPDSDMQHLEIETASTHIRSDIYEKGRWTYVFYNSSVKNPKNIKEILIREENGDLKRIKHEESQL